MGNHLRLEWVDLDRRLAGLQELAVVLQLASVAWNYSKYDADVGCGDKCEYGASEARSVANVCPFARARTATKQDLADLQKTCSRGHKKGHTLIESFVSVRSENRNLT
jgi:hypothetical protein